MMTAARILAFVVALLPLGAEAQITGGQQFFGNSTVTGSNACSAIGTNVIFPAQGSFVTNASGTKDFTVKFLIQNAANDLPLQYLTAVFKGDGTTVTYDPEIFGTFQGLSGTSNGAISLNFVLSLGNGNTPLVLNAPIPNTNQTCTISFKAVLYFSPD